MPGCADSRRVCGYSAGSVAAAGFLLWADLPHGPSRRVLVSGAAQCVPSTPGFTPPFPNTQKVAGAHEGHSSQGLCRGLASGEVSTGDKGQITLVALGW